MTDTRRPAGGPSGPPWSVDVLADLHAGVLDEAEAARLWPRVEADPEAMAVIAALDATRSDLAELGRAQATPIPTHVAARIDAALAAERHHGAGGVPHAAAGPIDLAAARRRRHRRLGWTAGLLTAAAAVAGAVAISVPNNTTAGNPVAQPTTEPGPPLTLRADDLGRALGNTLGEHDYGPLESRQRLDACRSAAGLETDAEPAGVRPVTIDGERAVLVVLTTGRFGQYRLIAFSPACGPGNPGILEDRTVGGTTR